MQVDHDKVTNAASRGALPIAFLTGKQIPMAFLGSIQLQVSLHELIAATMSLPTSVIVNMVLIAATMAVIVMLGSRCGSGSCCNMKLTATWNA